MNEAPPIWTVSDVNSALRDLIENSLMPIWVQAEIGTISIQRSGHVYLVLKDNRSQLKAVFFGGAAKALELQLQPGVKVEAFGKLSVYEVRGEYQLSIRTMRPVGVGDLQRKFEELKVKLECEGLFALDRKRPLPPLPRRIGVVTSPDGAAIRDFLQIITRRFPRINVRIYPAPVQGNGAENRLARGVEFFNRIKGADVIVVTRGGGSMEDLWPFNAEVLARAIAGSRIPVISAVGHEIDYTISDYVADLRAPTPSAAAELVIGKQEEYLDRTARLTKTLTQTLAFELERQSKRLELARSSYVFREPLQLVRQQQQRLDDCREALADALRQPLTASRQQLERLGLQLETIRPAALLQECRRRQEELRYRLKTAAAAELERRRAVLERLTAQSEAYSPYGILRRGYALLTDAATGQLVASVKQIAAGQTLQARVADGSINAAVTQVTPQTF